MKLLIPLGVLGLLDVLAWRFGVDSRDGRDWWSAPLVRSTPLSRSMFLKVADRLKGNGRQFGVAEATSRTRIVASGTQGGGLVTSSSVRQIPIGHLVPKNE